jgi:hypothetical protein
MNSTQRNPILETVIQTGETIHYCWMWFVTKIVAMSWLRLFAVILLVWILSGILALVPLANVFVLTALLVKCFVNPAEDSTAKPEPAAIALPAPDSEKKKIMNKPEFVPPSLRSIVLEVRDLLREGWWKFLTGWQSSRGNICFLYRFWC